MSQDRPPVDGLDPTIEAIRDRRPTFVDPTVEERFRADGFAVVPLLDPAQVALAQHLHDDLAGDDGAPISFDSIRPDRRAIEGMTTGLAQVWNDVLPRVIHRHRVVFSSCVVKQPGDRSGMEPHDDRSFVDERHARSLTIWMPLVDASPTLDNGHLAILPHSEHLARGFGGVNIPTWYAPFKHQLTSLLTPITAPAGTAVIYDSRSVHGSPPNRSNQPRSALVVVLAPVEAGLVQAVATSRRGRRLLAVDEAFHLRHSPLELRVHLPELPELDRFTDAPLDVSSDQIERLVGRRVGLTPQADRPADDQTGDGSPSSPRVQRVAGASRELLDAIDESDLTAPDIEQRLDALAGVRAVRRVVLAPGASHRHDDASAGTHLLPLATAALPAGVATAHDVSPFELGLLVGLAAGEPNQVFNDGVDPLPMLQIDLDTAEGAASVTDP